MLEESTIHYEKLQKFSLLNSYYAFLDTEEYLADNLFIQHQVTVHFCTEYERPGEPYRVILCRVRKSDEDRFLAALNELPRKMIIFGHTDYLEYCHGLWQKLREAKDKGGICHDTAGSLEQA